MVYRRFAILALLLLVGCTKPRPSVPGADPDTAEAVADAPDAPIGNDGTAPMQESAAAPNMPLKKRDTHRATTPNVGENVTGSEPVPLFQRPAKADPVVESPLAAMIDPASQPEDIPATKERFVLFAPGGPLVIEVLLTIDGKPAEAKMDELVRRVLAAADTDGDGSATWEEASHSPRLIYGQFGNATMGNARARNEVVRRCDTNHDGVVDAAEVPRLLTAPGGSASGFAVRRSDAPSSGRCWEQINTVKDGLLSAAEIAAAADRLRIRDSDSNEILFPAELSDEAPLAMGMAPPRRRGSEMATLLDPSTDWLSLLVSLETRYGTDGRLASASFPLVPELFGALDGDADGALSEEETATLTEVPAHLILGAHLGRGDDAGTPAPRIVVRPIGEKLSGSVAVLVERDNTVSLDLPGFRLSLSLADPAAPDGYTEQFARQFAAYDGDANDYLDEAEFTAARFAFMVPFKAVDTDDDGKIVLAEAAANQAQRRAAALSRVQAVAGNHADALFSALDTNADGRLGARELAAVPSNLAAMDRDGNGQLAGDEVPRSIVIRLVRGEEQGRNQIVTELPQENVAPDSPEWFSAMDVNGDGDLSRREFLGTAEQFAQLDGNADGFVAAGEATKQ